MFFFKKLFFVVLFIFIGISNSYSDQKIAFIDLDFVVENTNAGREILNELNLKVITGKKFYKSYWWKIRFD